MFRMGMKVNAEKSAIIHFRKKSCLQWDHEFSIGGEVIPMVTKYKYLGCVIDEFFDLNAMVDDQVEAGRRALGYLLQGLSQLSGCCLAVSSRSCTTPWYNLSSFMEPKLGVALDVWSLWNRSS